MSKDIACTARFRYVTSSNNKPISLFRCLHEATEGDAIHIGTPCSHCSDHCWCHCILECNQVRLYDYRDCWVMLQSWSIMCIRVSIILNIQVVPICYFCLVTYSYAHTVSKIRKHSTGPTYNYFWALRSFQMYTGPLLEIKLIIISNTAQMSHSHTHAHAHTYTLTHTHTHTYIYI